MYLPMSGCRQDLSLVLPVSARFQAIRARHACVLRCGRQGYCSGRGNHRVGRSSNARHVLRLRAGNRSRARRVHHGGPAALVAMRTSLRENSLSLFFFVIFVVAFFGQSLAGWRDFNGEATQHGAEAISWGAYVTSSEFGVAVLENWQSEYLQFALFILATIWLVQKGSNESKRLSDAGLESKRQQRIGYAADQSSPLWARVGGIRTAIYSNSLMIVMAIDLLRCLVRAVGHRLDRVQRAAGPARRRCCLVGGVPRCGPTSGSGRSRTGSRSSSPSGRWRRSRSTCASAARPSRSRSAPLTTRRRARARRCWRSRSGSAIMQADLGWRMTRITANGSTAS